MLLCLVAKTLLSCYGICDQSFWATASRHLHLCVLLVWRTLALCSLPGSPLQQRGCFDRALQHDTALHILSICRSQAREGNRGPAGGLITDALSLQAPVLKGGAALPQQRHNGGPRLGGRAGCPGALQQRLRRRSTCTATAGLCRLPPSVTRMIVVK